MRLKMQLNDEVLLRGGLGSQTNRSRNSSFFWNLSRNLWIVNLYQKTIHTIIALKFQKYFQRSIVCDVMQTSVVDFEFNGALMV